MKFSIRNKIIRESNVHVYYAFVFYPHNLENYTMYVGHRMLSVSSLHEKNSYVYDLEKLLIH